LSRERASRGRDLAAAEAQHEANLAEMRRAADMLRKALAGRI
jgi:hypothetical protein